MRRKCVVKILKMTNHIRNTVDIRNVNSIRTDWTSIQYFKSPYNSIVVLSKRKTLEMRQSNPPYFQIPHMLANENFQ